MGEARQPGFDLAERLAESKSLLAAAGLYVVAYELVKTHVVDQVRSFFSFEWTAEDGWIADETYATRVRSRSKHELDACLDWLVEAEAITEGGRQSIARLRKSRNEVAHKLWTFLVDPAFDLDPQPLLDTREVLRDLGRFFGRIEVEADPQWEGVDVDFDSIQSGVSVVYEHFLEQVVDFIESRSD